MFTSGVTAHHPQRRAGRDDWSHHEPSHATHLSRYRPGGGGVSVWLRISEGADAMPTPAQSSESDWCVPSRLGIWPWPADHRQYPELFSCLPQLLANADLCIMLSGCDWKIKLCLLRAIPHY